MQPSMHTLSVTEHSCEGRNCMLMGMLPDDAVLHFEVKAQKKQVKHVKAQKQVKVSVVQPYGGGLRGGSLDEQLLCTCRQRRSGHCPSLSLLRVLESVHPRTFTTGVCAMRCCCCLLELRPH